MIKSSWIIAAPDGQHALTKVGWEEGSQSYQIRGIRVLWVRKRNMTIYLYKILILGMGRKKKEMR